MPRPAAVSVFLLIVSTILFGANVVVYETLASILPLAYSASFWILGVLLGVLSGSFLVVTILGRYYYNWFTRMYTLTSSVWLGAFFYIFFASLLYGVVVGVTEMLLPQAGVVLLGGAVCISIYGYFHAKNIVITEVSVSLPNLPDVWKGKSAIWISDLHLGQIYGPSFTQRIVERINTIPHDLVFIGGDLFDGTTAPDLEMLFAPFKNRTSPHGVFFITGNHEEFGDNTQFLNAVRSANITLLIDEMLTVDGLQIIGVDYRNASNIERFKEILTKVHIDPNLPSILLKHEPRDLDIPEAAGVSLQISGHTHRAQLWPLEYIAKRVYRGYSYGLKNFKTMQVFVSSGVGTWGPPLRVGTSSEIVVFTFS